MYVSIPRSLTVLSIWATDADLFDQFQISPFISVSFHCLYTPLFVAVMLAVEIDDVVPQEDL